MARYKAAIDAGGDPAEIGAWITQAKAQRIQAEADLRKATSKARITRQQIEELITMTADIAATLHDADPAQMANAYRKLGVRLTYDPAGPLIRATASPQPGNLGKWFVSEGGLEHGNRGDFPDSGKSCNKSNTTGPGAPGCSAACL